MLCGGPEADAPDAGRHQWAVDAGPLKAASGAAAAAVLGPDGQAPRAGQLHRNPDLGATFRSLARHGALEGAGKPARRPPHSTPTSATDHIEPREVVMLNPRGSLIPSRDEGHTAWLGQGRTLHVPLCTSAACAISAWTSMSNG